MEQLILDSKIMLMYCTTLVTYMREKVLIDFSKSHVIIRFRNMYVHYMIILRNIIFNIAVNGSSESFTLLLEVMYFLCVTVSTYESLISSSLF